MLFRIDFRAMGTNMIAMLDSSSSQAPDELSQVPNWFEDWEQTLSRFRKDSELNQLNRSAGWPVHVSQTIWEVFQAAVAAETASEGLVKATVLDAMLNIGYDRSLEELPHERPLQEVTPWNKIPSLAEVSLDEKNQTICLPADVHLDFGGIAKGWAAQQAANKLSKWGPALVSAGGDMAITGERPNAELWPVTIDDPFNQGEVIANLGLSACGIATSGTDYRRWKMGGRWNHHIIDPRTGQSAQTDLVAASIIAPDVLQAEMAAKAVIILGSQDGMRWIEARPGFSAMLVTETNGEIILSNHISQFFWRS
jgi:thiamine biosynthesis lipoprotein